MISVLAQLFTAPPYNFSVGDVGLVSIAPLIASFCGFVAGPLNDWVVKRLARLNKGIYEPEFRLSLNILTLILGVIGFFGFGAALKNQDPWPGPVILYGVIYFAMSFLNIGYVSSFTIPDFGAHFPRIYGYITECHRNKAPEAFASLNLRNIYSFGMNYFISSWITKEGPLEVFSIIGGLHIFICLLTIPMWIFGKKCRSMTARLSIFKAIQNT